MEEFVAENTIVDKQWCRICQCMCMSCQLGLKDFPCTCPSKKVNQKWILLGLNRHEYERCKVCAALRLHRPQIVPQVFSSVLVRALRLSVWALVFLLNAFCFSLHPWGLETVIDNQGGLQVSWIVGSLLSALFYSGLVAHVLTIVTVLRLIVEDIFGFHREIGNHLQYAQLLWTPLRILSDWWHDLLFCCGFFHTILDGPRDVVVYPRNAQLSDFGTIRRLLFFLDDTTFAVLAISMYVSCLFSLLPYLIGISVSTVFLCFPSIDTIPFVSNSSPIFVGYSVMVSVSAQYLAMRLISFQTGSQMLLFTALAPIIMSRRLLVRIFRNPRGALQLLSWINNSFVYYFKIMVCPLLLGFYMDFCTIPMTGSSYSRKIELVSTYPFCIFLHWFGGFTWLLITCGFLRVIFNIIGGERPLWCLEHVTEISKLHYRQFLSAFAFQVTLICIAVHLPTTSISLISSSFFPLQFWAYESKILFGSMAAYGFLVRIGVLEWLADLIGGAIQPIIGKWITLVSSWLQHMQIERRVSVMLVLAALTIYLVSIASMALPILVGRAFFQFISFAMQEFGLKQDDLYSFWIGCFLLRVIYTVTRFVYQRIRMWIALLILLVEVLVIISSVVPQDETRLFGIVILHLWTYAMLFTGINRFENLAWRERLQRIRDAIIYRLPSQYLILLGLILESAITLLCFPLLAGVFIWPILGVIIVGLGFVAKVCIEAVYWAGV